ncbi:MAG: tetratricopeptide repeat protein [Pirellulales bacterium]|nr:tetratricopeptide repeat protein [Pirellulales bacterium]
MNPRRLPDCIRLLIALPLLAAAIGCAGATKSLEQEGITKQRKERSERAKELFELNKAIAEKVDDSTENIDLAGYEEVAEEGPSVELLHIGQAALAEGSEESARDYFRQAVAAKPDDPRVPISAAVAALRANRPALAVELLAPAAERFPDSASVHRALGAAYYRSGDYKSSQVVLRKALSLDKSNPLSYLLLGCTLAKLGQTEAAESHLRQARAMDPKYTVTR